MIETDGDLINPNSNIFPHPRSYGSFPRVLSKYVRELKILTLEQAIQKMTSMTAMQIRQDDLGKIVSGAYADLIVFDEDEIEEKDGSKISLTSGSIVEWVEEESFFFRNHLIHDSI